MNIALVVPLLTALVTALVIALANWSVVPAPLCHRRSESVW